MPCRTPGCCNPARSAAAPMPIATKPGLATRALARAHTCLCGKHQAAQHMTHGVCPSLIPHHHYHPVKRVVTHAVVRACHPCLGLPASQLASSPPPDPPRSQPATRPAAPQPTQPRTRDDVVRVPQVAQPVAQAGPPHVRVEGALRRQPHVQRALRPAAVQWRPRLLLGFGSDETYIYKGRNSCTRATGGPATHACSACLGN